MLIENQAPIAITYDPHWIELWGRRFSDPLVDAETLRLNNDQTIVEIGNKPKSVQEIQGQYMGLLRFTPEGWNELVTVRETLSSKARKSIHMTAMLQKIVEADKIRIAAMPYTGDWGEIDSKNDLELYSV